MDVVTGSEEVPLKRRLNSNRTSSMATRILVFMTYKPKKTLNWAEPNIVNKLVADCTAV